MNFKNLLFTLLAATTFTLGACASDEPATKAEAITSVCDCIIEDKEGAGEEAPTQASCESDIVAPMWTAATQACFDCTVEAASCRAMEACFATCPPLD